MSRSPAIASKPLAVRARPEGGDVGYIRISQFDAQTVDQLRQAIKDITASIASDKLKGYVIDLRNNPGGTLEQADRGRGRLPG